MPPCSSVAISSIEIHFLRWALDKDNHVFSIEPKTGIQLTYIGAENPSAPLKIALLANGSYVVNLTTKAIIGGFEVGFLELILKGLHMPYTLDVPEKLVWGIPDQNGNCSGVMGMVQRGEADMDIGSMFVTQARMTVADFSTPYTFCLTKFYPIRRLAFEIFGALLQKSFELESDVFRDRCLILSWIVACTFLSYAYTAVWLDFLSVPVKERPVKTITQLAKLVADGKHRCFSVNGSGVAVSMMNSVYESHRIVGSYIDKNNVYLDLQNNKMIFKFMNQGNTAWIVTRERIRFDSQDMYYISRDNFFSFPVAIVLN
ncbi:uncharacterized protein TNCV_4721711 [Trichonephila clavipes]|uniref:Ionotropic glutamate receptor L-glutamate and glycine-binding domain-containing protein n=1 Tax=Trichonephila clavipes TaxID=2585209 RepID=A0A8X7BF77_TRICX|nr:uncharacterized protein TNCV_4721711 [Trichonephila clavipes]